MGIEVREALNVGRCRDRGARGGLVQSLSSQPAARVTALPPLCPPWPIIVLLIFEC
jgi:hypothetical protein